MARRRDKLSDKHYEAIRMIANKRRETYDDIADKLGISRRQLYRWRQRKDFARLLDRTIEAEVNRRVRVMKKRMRYNDAESIEFILRNTGLLT